MKLLITLALCSSLCGCWWNSKQSTYDSSLCRIECPDSLGALYDSSFGATVKKLKEVSDTYHACRCACLPEALNCTQEQAK